MRSLSWLNLSLFALAASWGCGSSDSAGGAPPSVNGPGIVGSGGATVPVGSGGTGVNVAGAGGTGVMVGTGGGGPMGTGGTVMVGGTGGEMANTGEPSISKTPIQYDDPMMKCYELRVHAEGNKMAPWTVPTTPDLYTEFYFQAPWTGTQYLRSMRYLKGNETVIHHYLLFREGGGADGSIGPMALHAGGQLVQGWAPGGQDVYYSKDLGMAMPPEGYILESHHNNTTGLPASDNTGIEICVTTVVPKTIASLTWLGSDLISGITASGTCTPPIQANAPVHILGGTPHMHTAGIHMKVTINHVGGAPQVIHDLPFDFMSQTSYPLDGVVMNAGDTITTDCTYNRPSTFGQATSNEMCYFFTVYYPAGVMQTPGIGSVIHGPNTCGI